MPDDGGDGLDLDLSKYLGLFVSEARDHLEGLSRALVALERAGAAGEDPRSLIDGMFRHAHSVKGMAGTMQFEGIARLAHRAEDVIGALRAREAKVEPEVVDLLLGTADALLAMVQATAGGGRPAEPDPGLLQRLADATAAVRQGTPACDAEPGRGAGTGGTGTQGSVPAAGPAGPASPSGGAAPSPRGDGASLPPDAVPLNGRFLRVEVEVAAGCPVPSVRAYLVLKRLTSVGAVRAAEPGVDALKAGSMPGRRLVAVLDTGGGPAEVRAALAHVADLARIEVEPFVPGAQARPAVPEAASAPAPPPGAPPEGARAPGAAAAERAAEAVADAQRTVRIRAELLDAFLDSASELLLATARVRELGRPLPQPHRRAHDEGVDRLHAILKDLHGKVMTARMTPLAQLADRLPRAARDLARRTGKQVDVAVSGADIEIDRALLEDLGDPILHVLRNAVDHGIEPAAERIAAGKSATGRVALTARRERDRMVVEISDDGRGMDPGRLRESAVARGALSAEAAAALSDREALLLACLPGVSTAREVTDVSGRGVGMDAVKRVVEAVGGSLEIESEGGKGTRLTLRLPLTVIVQPVLLVRVGVEVVGVPVSKVHGVLDLAADGSVAEIRFGGATLPVHDLAGLLGFARAPAGGRRSVVVAEVEGGRVGLAVDQLLGQEEAVLKPLHQPLTLVAGLSAVTVLGSGRPVFILDVGRLLAA